MIGTNCAAVFWSQSHDLQLVNLTIANSLLDTVDGGTHQGVALRTDGDRIQLQNVRLLGRQDTLYLNVSNRHNDALTDRINRVYVQDSYIEGDVDYVFGRANVVFDGVHFHTVSSRQSPEAYVLAPNTLPTILTVSWSKTAVSRRMMATKAPLKPGWAAHGIRGQGKQVICRARPRMGRC